MAGEHTPAGMMVWLLQGPSAVAWDAADELSSGWARVTVATSSSAGLLSVALGGVAGGALGRIPWPSMAAAQVYMSNVRQPVNAPRGNQFARAKFSDSASTFCMFLVLTGYAQASGSFCCTGMHSDSLPGNAGRAASDCLTSPLSLLHFSEQPQLLSLKYTAKQQLAVRALPEVALPACMSDSALAKL